MINFLINLLFRLLGNTYHKLYKIQYLFGATSLDHPARKKNWEKALVRLWKDKDMLDFLFYQAESDKERAWQGKIDKKLSQGARIRTLFLVYSAKRAYESQRIRKGRRGQEQEDIHENLKKTQKAYNDITDVT